MIDDTGSGLTDRARVAFGLHEWDEAFELLMRADASGSLPAADLPLLGESAYASGHLDTSRRGSVPTRRACWLVTTSQPLPPPYVSRCTCCSTPR
jgi:hypothetical protein